MHYCTDINECIAVTNGTDICGVEAECINKLGDYECRCKEGYEGDPKTVCIDVDECSQTNACGVNSKCYNVPGSFKCLCPKGFTGNPYDYCES